jgi:pimeloyl-ACP methyl ester carboxylesterase
MRLLDHLGLQVADYAGYSMGAQIGLRTVLRHADRVRRAVLCGIGATALEPWQHGEGIARRMRGDDSETSPAAKMFYEFAIRVPGNDLEALACCITGRSEPVTREELASIRTPILIAAGGADPIAGDPQRLADLIPGAELFIVPGRDHTTAVPARAIKERALEFLERA